MQRRWMEQRRRRWTMLVIALVVAPLLGGCEEDCVNCVEPAPVAPTQVYSESGDEAVTLYWNDYPEIYDEGVLGYRIWKRRYLPDDHLDPERTFEYAAEVPAGQNYDPDTGQYHWIDVDVDNAVDYEYAVSAYNETSESYLSFEFVVDTPLPMSESPLTLHDVFGDHPEYAGFDFSVAAASGGGGQNGAAGIVDPTAPGTQADVRVRFDGNGVPWLDSLWSGVRLQDYGTFLDENDQLDFGGVSWAPEFGWSGSGTVELIPGHIYVIEIWNEFGAEDLHYAKLGVESFDPGGSTVRIMWAYQLVNGLPELSVPEPGARGDAELEPIRL